MNTHSSHVLELFPNLRVLVIGEAILDSYLAGAAGRLCSEAPVPVVDVQTHSDVPGGAANTAANIHSMGAHVALLSVIGDDDEGARLRPPSLPGALHPIICWCGVPAARLPNTV
ncbi:MAG: hypothetical protein HC893_02370 [Chloroflexaceae bacterium]|nr:hypothetical protein [Chloroflexaceae bacterium]